MWGKKKKKNGHSEFKFPFLVEDDEPLKINEAELENELMDLLGEDAGSSNQTNKSDPTVARLRAGEAHTLQELTAEEGSTGSVEFSEDDPELLAELEQFISEKDATLPDKPKAPVELQGHEQERQSSSVGLSDVQERLSAYRVALANLKTSQPLEASRIRRYERAVQQLEGFVSILSKGKSVNPEDLPPPPPTSLLSETNSAIPVNSSSSDSKEAGLKALKSRLEEYKLAASKAQSEGNSKRAAILTEASQMIADVIPKIEAGLEPFDAETDLPPPPSQFEVDTTPDQPESVTIPQPTAPTNPSSEAKSPPNAESSLAAGIIALKKRKQEYKLAAVEARDSGNLERAKALLQAAKVIEEIIPKVESGEEAFCIETDLPPPPGEFQATDGDSKSTESAEAVRKQPLAVPTVARSTTVTVENVRARLEYYQAALAEAKTNQSDGSRQRRLARVVNHYKEALKACEHGITNFNYSELPPPPQCPTLMGVPVVKSKISGVPNDAGGSATQGNRSERIVALLQTRQNELKAYALQAKQSGNMDVARAHLRAALSINPMIESAKVGLTVDFSKLPRLPTNKQRSGEESLKIPTATNVPVRTGTVCDPPPEFLLELNAASNVAERNQVLMHCMDRQLKEATLLFKNLESNGWPERAQTLSELISGCKSALLFGQKCRTQEKPIPFQFEWTNLPSVNMNADLSDNVLEVCVVRGFAYPLPPKFTSPTQLDTYVEIVFPFPSSEKAQQFSTPWFKRSVEPTYEATVRFDADTKSRTYSRFTQSERAVKATVYYNAGLFKGPRPLGTASFPLRELANSATIRPVSDLLEGRRAVGGRLMLQFRQRASLCGPPVMTSRKQWLYFTVPVVHEHLRVVTPRSQSSQRTIVINDETRTSDSSSSKPRASPVSAPTGEVG